MKLGFIGVGSKQSPRLTAWSLGTYFWFLPFVFCLLVLFSSCAKKMLPPSPDRFAPHLVEVNSRTRVQLELVFNEEIDTRRLVLDSFTSDNGLVLKGISQGRDRSSVVLWTGVQEGKDYSLSGIVWDRAGNRGQFRTRITGSTRIDTIPPRVVSVSPEPGRVNVFRKIRVSVRFSEPVDTTVLQWYIVPREYETLFQRSWEANWQEVQFVCKDSIPRGKEVYFILQPGVKDLEGNRSDVSAWTYFSSDSIFFGVRVHGRVFWDEKGNMGEVSGGIVFFNIIHGEEQREQTVAMAPILRDGSFETKVRPGRYFVFAVSDTNSDGLIDLKCDRVEFNTTEESLRLFLAIEILPKHLNEYRY